MRYMVDLAVFVAVFLFGCWVFQSAFYAILAAIVVAGAAEALLDDSLKR